MKKLLFTLMVFIAASNAVIAAPFSPTMLKLSVDPFIRYDFEREPIDIPVEVEGTPAGIIFCIYTKDWHNGIDATRNGYLGWHYVNRVDTCIYYSTMHSYEPGPNTITWDGKDQDGNYVPRGVYTYYMWAFDNQGEKQLMSNYLDNDIGFDYRASIREVDKQGLPLANPVWYTADSRWYIGSDPEDESALIKSIITLDDGWEMRGDSAIQDDDLDFQFISVLNRETGQGSLQKIKFVPDGDAEIIRDWNGDGYSEMFQSTGGVSAGVLSDGDYLYTTDVNYASSVDTNSDLYIYDHDGDLVTGVDLTPWWNAPEDAESGGQVNGGPVSFEGRHNRIIFNSHISCLRQMIDPLRYLESGKTEDLVVWMNGNGDYTLEKNFEDTATRPWACIDSTTGVYTYGIDVDDNLFTMYSSYGVGAASFGLLGPDGTGFGYVAFAKESSGPKSGQKIIDSDTPFDGIYCDNGSYYIPSGGCGWLGEECPSISFIGHDSIKGEIGFYSDCFGAQGYITIDSPNGGERLVPGETADITWTVTRGCYTPKFVNIEYSFDFGSTWNIIKRSMWVDDGMHEWQVPEIEAGSCYIRFTSPQFGTEYDMSDETFSIGDGVGVGNTSPYSFTLSQNSPNPFNPVTLIPFTLPKESAVTLTVYNIAGEKVTELVNTTLSAGKHSVDWDASGVSSGMYFARLRAGEFVETVKMMVVK